MLAPIRKVILSNACAFVVGCLFLIHLFFVNELTVGFPYWGDDLGLMDFVRRYHEGQLKYFELFVPFHNGIHSNFVIKFIFLLEIKLFGSIYYKSTLFIAQLLNLPILWMIYQFFKKLALPIWVQLAAFLLYFNFKGQIDQLNLLGVLQHTLTFFCICWAAYLAFLKNRFGLALLVLNLGLLLVSAEIMGAIFLLLALMFLFKIPHRILLLIGSLGSIFFYYLCVNYSHNILNIQATAIHLNQHFVKGLLIFLGSGIPFSNSNLIVCVGGSLLFIAIIYLLKMKFSQASEKVFPVYIFGSLLLIGALIQVGRSDGPGLNFAFSTSMDRRFSFYHLMFLLMTFLMLYSLLKDKLKQLHVVLLLFIGMFNILSFYRFFPDMKSEKWRVTLDIYNFGHSFDNTLYPIKDQFAFKMVQSKTLYLPEIQLLNNVSFKNRFKVESRRVDGDFVFLLSQSRTKSNLAKLITSTNKIYFVPIQTDQWGSSIKLSLDWVKMNQIKEIFCASK